MGWKRIYDSNGWYPEYTTEDTKVVIEVDDVPFTTNTTTDEIKEEKKTKKRSSKKKG